MPRYIHELSQWPQFTWDDEALLFKLGEVRNSQGKLVGKMSALGFDLKDEATLGTLTLDVLKSSEIEGEIFDMAEVRSSLARHLGMEITGLVASGRNVDGMVEMLLDATQQYEKPLTAERLFDWHSSLFPAGRSGMHKITIANWREDTTGPMQVVSGDMGKEKVHFQAIDAAKLDQEMTVFLNWLNTTDKMDPVIKAALAHLWFITIHPFDDGNGRIARAITDMLLARSDGGSQRFYSISAQIRLERKAYYNILEKTQKSTLDVTDWLYWFLDCLMNAVTETDHTLSKVLFKAQFWKTHAAVTLNERQKLLVNKLLDGFDGKLNSSKWAKIAKCSADSALRDIRYLIAKGMLRKEEAGGRSTSYEIDVSKF